MRDTQLITKWIFAVMYSWPAWARKTMLLLTICISVATSLGAQTGIYRQSVQLNWQLEYAQDDRSRKKTTEATVPGSVELDIAAAENYGDFFYGENWKDYRWMEERPFTYITEFSRPSLAAGDRLFLISEGIDYSFEILFNGSEMLRQEGMYTPVRLDLTNVLKEDNELIIKVLPTPELHPDPTHHIQAMQLEKPASDYRSDSHPHLIASGIWNETYLQIQKNAYISDVQMRYSLNENLTAVEIRVTVEGANFPGNNLIWKLRDERDKIIVARVIKPESNEIVIDATLERPTLWWPHDHGTPHLYTYELELRNTTNELLETVTKKVGFRRIELVKNEWVWEKSSRLPDPQNTAAAQLMINGQKIFVKGAGITAPAVFTEKITEERYEKITDLAVQANLNLLRVWSGTGINKKAFYEQCDRKGLLVWQELPLAGKNYRSTREYLDLLEQESESIIRRLRDHPSIAIWSGGNGLFSASFGLTGQSHLLRLLNSQCLKLDPQTPFIYTSPLEGMAAGPALFRDPESNKEVFEQMDNTRATAYTEFGIPAPAPVKVLRKIIPEKELWPPQPGTAWESHGAFNIGATSGAWMIQEIIEDYFGPSGSLEKFVENGQLIQSEGYKAIYEEARRQKPLTGMAIARFFNESWPAAAGTSIISWPDILTPAFYSVRDACRPVLASARIKKIKWTEGELFEADLFFLNDKISALDQGRMVVTLVVGGRELTLLNWDHDRVEPNHNLQGPTVRKILPKWDVDRFRLRLEVLGHPEYNSEYLLLYEKSE